MAEKKRSGSIVKKTLVVVAVILVLFLGVVAVQPAEFSVSRSATIDASPATVFAQVNDFHNWEAWSPWARLDPNAKNSFDGPAAGKGAKFHWAGNDAVGEGGMEITESIPNELIRFRLDFVKPFESTCTTVFNFEPDGDRTKVVWTMSGQNNFIGRIFCLFMNMDKMVGGDFEKGLASMKDVAERQPTGETQSAAEMPTAEEPAEVEPASEKTE